MNKLDDLVRLRQEYDNRKLRLEGKVLYSYFYNPYVFFIQQRLRILLKGLKNIGINSIGDNRILEIGCGNGGVLLEFQTIGTSQKQLFGIDLLFDRLYEAHNKLHSAGISCANGQYLPFRNKSFDLVIQYTAFSSVLDYKIKEQMAHEMLRVLRPEGAIIWYDFWLNPTNSQTKGIRPDEIKHLFSNCSFKFNKITLAPPIARRIIPISWALGMFLESIKILNSHYLVMIKK
jgi:ubiquinone/menaquinone biosynthesis C-methylase UbiE